MNRKDLINKLNEAHVDNSRYNLTGMGVIENRFVLEPEDNRWHVYYAERGRKYEEKWFDTEDEACAYFLQRLLPRKPNRPIPLGSIVRLEGGSLKLMVVSRGLRVPGKDGEQYYFDYGAVAYPNGLISLEMAYFQQESVAEVLFWGYTDADDANFLESIRQFLAANPKLKRGTMDHFSA